MQESIDIVRAHHGEVTSVAMLVDRSDGSVKLGVPVFSLIQLHVEAFAPDNLPAELAKIPALKPGSK